MVLKQQGTAALYRRRDEAGFSLTCEIHFPGLCRSSSCGRKGAVPRSSAPRASSTEYSLLH